MAPKRPSDLSDHRARAVRAASGQRIDVPAAMQNQGQTDTSSSAMANSNPLPLPYPYSPNQQYGGAGSAGSSAQHHPYTQNIPYEVAGTVASSSEHHPYTQDIQYGGSASAASSSQQPLPDDVLERFCREFVDRFVEQVNSSPTEQAFLPWQEYVRLWSRNQTVPHQSHALSAYFWQNAGPSKKTNRVCWSWRYLAGCALIIDNKYPRDATVKFSKQDRSEWNKVARFANTVVTKTAQRTHNLAYLALDTLAMNPGLCRALRKLSRQRTADAAHCVARTINTLDLPTPEVTTNSMDVLRIFEDILQYSATALGSTVGLPVLLPPQQTVLNAPGSSEQLRPPWRILQSSHVPEGETTHQFPQVEPMNAPFPGYAPDPNNLSFESTWSQPQMPAWGQPQAPVAYNMNTQFATGGYSMPQDIMSSWVLEDHTPSITSELGHSPTSGLQSDYMEDQDALVAEELTRRLYPRR